MYIVDWANGNTDVFLDAADAAECYAVGNSSEDSVEVSMLKHATESGHECGIDDAIADTAPADVWSDRAKLARQAFHEGYDAAIDTLTACKPEMRV